MAPSTHSNLWARSSENPSPFPEFSEVLSCPRLLASIPTAGFPGHPVGLGAGSGGIPARGASAPHLHAVQTPGVPARHGPVSKATAPRPSWLGAG